MSRLPLQGVVVLDFSRYLAGPFATMILRDLGARVIKFEPSRGDPARSSGPFMGGDSAYFHPINRGKESVVVDLRDARDVAAVRRLLARADCLVEAFRPGVMDRIGLGHETALSVNPRLIYAACSGFGADGPYASRPAFDVVAQAMGGVMSVTGEPDRPPTRVGVSQGDMVGGLYTALAVMAALHARSVSGRGAFVDISILEAQMALATHAFGIWAATGQDPPRIGNRHPAVAPFDVYPTADAYVAIATVEDGSFVRMCRALELGELIGDRRFESNESRIANVGALTEAITRAVSGMTTDEAVARLLDASVACGPVLGIGDLVDDAHVRARGSLLRVSPWGAGGLPVPTLPFKVDGRRFAVEGRGPELGSRTLEELEKELSEDR
jgi:CoA:oxalate CoA-transferase